MSRPGSGNRTKWTPASVWCPPWQTPPSPWSRWRPPWPPPSAGPTRTGSSSSSPRPCSTPPPRTLQRQQRTPSTTEDSPGLQDLHLLQPRPMELTEHQRNDSLLKILYCHWFETKNPWNLWSADSYRIDLTQWLIFVVTILYIRRFLNAIPFSLIQ